MQAVLHHQAFESLVNKFYFAILIIIFSKISKIRFFLTLFQFLVEIYFQSFFNFFFLFKLEKFNKLNFIIILI